MREIKFRAWDKRDKKWAFIGFDVMGEVWLFGLLNQYCFDTKGDVTTVERINDIEITQYTGLKDKNGNEIYEGDIWQVTTQVRVGTRVVQRRRNIDTYDITEFKTGYGIVEWNGHQYEAKLNLYDDYPSYFYVLTSKDKPFQVHEQIIKLSTTFGIGEVIGNIYETV